MNPDVDLEGNGEGYSGTFRWRKSKALPSMPPYTHTELSLHSGWMEYFLSRCSSTDECKALVHQATNDLCLIDCISTPVTIGKLIQETNLHIPLDHVSIVIIGTSSKAEERIAKETNSFHELSHILHHYKVMDVWLVGPEMSSNTAKFEHKALNMNMKSFRGSAIDFFRAHTQLLTQPTIVVGVNCGFGNWANPPAVRYNLLESWLPDLFFLTSTKLPLFFTCANDTEDLIGEVSLMQKVMGANFILAPQPNKFDFASTLVNDEKNQYSRGNSFYYGVQGFSRARRRYSMDISTVMNTVHGIELVSCETLLVKPTLLVPISTCSSPSTTATTHVSCTKDCDVTPSDSPESLNPQSNNASDNASSVLDQLRRKPVTSEVQVYQAHQAVIDNSLQIKIQFSQELDMSRFSMDINDAGTQIRLHVEEIDYDIPLLESIVSTSLKAKHSKKKNTVTVSGVIRV